MEFERGTVVKSIAGRDKDLWFIVWEDEGDTVLLVDGKLRPLENPKRKKKKHCRVTKKILSLSDIPIGNKAIRTLLQENVNENGSAL